MRHVLGEDVDDQRLRRAVRSVLYNAARNYVDLLKMPRLKLTDIEKRVTVHGWHNYEDAIKKGRGVILVTAHLGSFDITSQILASHSVNTTVIVEAQEPAAFSDHVTGLRKSKGLTFVPVQPGVLSIIMQTLDRGETVGLVCDRDITRDGYKSTFFGEETTTPVGAVRIAMRTGAAIVPAFNFRRNGSNYEAYVEPALEIINDGYDAVAKNMQQLIGAMEKFIRTCPEQWVVLGPIWENGYRKRCAARSQCLAPS